MKKHVAVLTGLLFNLKAVEYFQHHNLTLDFFYKYSKLLQAKHGNKMCNVMAKYASAYYSNYSELITLDNMIKRISKIYKDDDDIAVTKKIWGEAEEEKEMTFAEWREHLDDLIREYREFSHKDITSKTAKLYEMACLGEVPLDSRCKDCGVRKECALLKDSATEDTSAWVLDWASSTYDELRRATSTSFIKYHKVTNLLDEAITFYETPDDGKKAKYGPPTPWPSMEKQIKFFQPGRVYMVWSRTGVGKSAFLLQCSNVAAAAGWPVLYFNLEMPTKEELIHRIVSYCAGFDFGTIMKFEIQPDQIEGLKEKVVQWRSNINENYYIIDIPKRSKLSIVTNIVDRFIAKHGNKIFIAIDYFSLLYTDEKAKRNEALAILSQDLHDFARQREIPILTAGQLNRDADRAKWLTPRHTRGSDEIMDNIDVNWGLISLTDDLLRVQTIKGRYVAKYTFMLEKHMDKMKFVEREKGVIAHKEEDEEEEGMGYGDKD